MGMFDSVWFTCPECKNGMEVQSKAGACSLNNYSSDQVPETIAEAISGETAYCNCGKKYVVGEEHKKKLVSVGLREII